MIGRFLAYVEVYRQTLLGAPERDSNPRPKLYESLALPLSYQCIWSGISKLSYNLSSSREAMTNGSV
jgi:hypothetical protein